MPGVSFIAMYLVTNFIWSVLKTTLFLTFGRDFLWMLPELYIQSCVEYALVFTENQQKTYVHFNTYLHTMSKTQIKLDLRVLSFCLGLYSIEIFNLGVQLNRKQSRFINELCLIWASAWGKEVALQKSLGVLSLTFMGPENHMRCKICNINQFVTMPPVKKRELRRP